MIRRIIKWVGIILLVLVGLPVVVLAIAVGLANIDYGRHLIERETASLTGGTVRIEGLAGTFPDDLHAARIELSDTKGVYAVVTGFVLDWSPLKLIGGVASVDQLSAQTITVRRMPVSSKPASSKSSSFSLPVRVDVKKLVVDKTTLEPPVLGTQAVLALNGSANLRTLTEGTVHLDMQRLDQPGTYHADADLTGSTVTASVTAKEPANGLIATVAKLPDLGPVAIKADVKGPKDAMKTQVGVSAGPLSLAANGTVDAVHDAADMTLHAQSPAMKPAPDIAWNRLLVDAHVQGPFNKLDASGTVRLDGLTAPEVRMGSLAADVQGNSGHINLHATIDDLHVPGPKPDLVAGSPVVLDAAVTLDAPDRPATFHLSHKLIDLRGTAHLGSAENVVAHLTLPDLAPLAQAAGAKVSGHTELDLAASMAKDKTVASVKGTVAITGGMAPLPALIGEDGTVDLAATMQGHTVTLSNLAVTGKSVALGAKGVLSQQAVNLDWSASLKDLSAVEPKVAGTLNATGRASGAPSDLTVHADVTTNLATQGYSSGQVIAHIDATGLPSAPKARITADGTLLGAPLSVALTADRTDGAVHVDIGSLAWKSLQGGGSLSLAPSATLPTGDLRLSFTHLADLQPLIGRKLAGSAEMTLNADAQAARLGVRLADVSVPGTAALQKAVLDATVTHLTDQPVIDASLTAAGISAGSVRGASAKASAKGPLSAIQTSITAQAPEVAGNPVRFAAAGTVDETTRSIALAKLEAAWKDQIVRLLAPAHIELANGIAVDRLRLGYRQAELAVSGKVAAKDLDLTASLRNLSADVASVVDPSLAVDGTIAMNAHLTGTTSRPEGTIKLTASRLHMRKGAGQGLPPANLEANVTLQGTDARLDTRLTAGTTKVSVTGTVPLSTTGPIDLHTDGRMNLAMLDPILSAAGRRARGEITLNGRVTGTEAAPRVNGTLALRNGDVVDYKLGTHLSDLTALVEANGETSRLVRFSGKAGPGTLGGNGTVTLTGEMPVDLHFTADNARLLASDLMTARFNADVAVRGAAKGNMEVAGTVTVRRADIRIPDKLPASVAVLPVRNANAPPPKAAPPPASGSTIALNLTIAAPEQVFVRGRGLDAELAGTIHVHGTVANPEPSGGLHLRRGTLSIIGTTLTFTEGTVTFTGAGITDPSIHFVANSTTPTLTAILTVSGTAKDPKITLSSTPDMPQDEILSQLLFNTSTAKLSPFQLAQIASALASLSGATGGLDPLNELRNAFGLDRLSVGSNSNGSPTLEAGRYLSRGVYAGVKQSASGGAPQASLQVDLAKGLKLQATAGGTQDTATGARQTNDSASVGLTYQFQY